MENDVNTLHEERIHLVGFDFIRVYDHGAGFPYYGYVGRFFYIFFYISFYLLNFKFLINQ